MATVYKVEIVSYWINYTDEEIKQLIEKAFEKEKEHRVNELKITITE